MEWEEAIDHLKFHGTETHKWILDIIINDDRSFERLARILTYQRYQDNTHGTYAPWIPIYALHILAKIGTKRAQIAIISALIHYPDMLYDSWISEKIPNALAYMGPKSVDSLCHVVSLSSASIYSRYCAASTLVIIALEHPQEKQKVIKTIRDSVQREPDIDDRTFLMDSLVDLRDPDVSEYLKRSLESGFVTNEFFEYGDLLETYTDESGIPAKYAPTDPLDIFDDADCKTTKQNDDLHNMAYGRKLGRNDPCPCMSGKKYKKCCMPKPN